MSRVGQCFICFVAFWLPITTFGQFDKQSNFDKYFQINLEYRQLNESKYIISTHQPEFSIIGILQPGFSISSPTNGHEISLTALQFKRDTVSSDFKRQTFALGGRYQYRHAIARLASGLSLAVGGSLEMNYRSMRFQPKWIGPTDVKLKLYIYSLSLDSSVTFKLNDKIAFDLDLPYPVWKGMYRNQRNKSTQTGNPHRLVERTSDMFPEYTFNFIAGVRCRL